MLRVWAPGRVNLIGEHTDYSGGLVLPVAIELGLTFDVEARDDETIRLVSAGFPAGDAFSADGTGPPVQGWLRYGQAVAAELDALGRPPIGINATISSTLPAGAGLSSSAALEVGIALSLCAVADFRVPPLELAAACQRAEARAVGVPCGLLDPAAILLGEKGRAILLNCGTLEHELIPIPPRAAFLILDSGVERRLSDTRYAERRKELESALALRGVENSTELDAADPSDADPLFRRRLRHVQTENERVVRFAAALATADLPTAGKILAESHESLRDDYEVSTPELDELVARAQRLGALGARLVGGGFGGSVLALVKHEDAPRVRDAMARECPGLAPPVIIQVSAGAQLTAADRPVMPASG